MGVHFRGSSASSESQLIQLRNGRPFRAFHVTFVRSDSPGARVVGSRSTSSCFDPDRAPVIRRGREPALPSSTTAAAVSSASRRGKVNRRGQGIEVSRAPVRVEAVARQGRPVAAEHRRAARRDAETAALEIGPESKGFVAHEMEAVPVGDVEHAQVVPVGDVQGVLGGGDGDPQGTAGGVDLLEQARGEGIGDVHHGDPARAQRDPGPVPVQVEVLGLSVEGELGDDRGPGRVGEVHRHQPAFAVRDPGDVAIDADLPGVDQTGGAGGDP